MTPDPAGQHAAANAARPPETTDRLLVGICGAIWLVWLVVAVIATVACVNLGRGRGAADNAPWLLYTIIAVSGVTILAAIPLLLRARRDALSDRFSAEETPAAPRESPPVRAGVPAEAPTEKIRVFGTSVDPVELRTKSSVRQAVSQHNGEIDRQWLRGTVCMLGAMGLGWISVAVATYLLAVGSDTAAVAALVTAGIASGAIVAAFVVFSRRLGDAARR